MKKENEWELYIMPENTNKMTFGLLELFASKNKKRLANCSRSLGDKNCKIVLYSESKFVATQIKVS